MPERGKRAVATLFALLIVGCSSAAAQNASPGPPSIGAVLKEVPLDLWRFFSWDTAAVVGIGSGAALVGHIWDDDLAGEVETNGAGTRRRRLVHRRLVREEGRTGAHRRRHHAVATS
jgi:hypothetical protein